MRESMLDDLFTKSLKPQNDLLERKKRSFSERHQDKFKPEKKKEVKFYNEQTIKSVHNKDLKFTNFFSGKTKCNVLQRLYELSKDLSVIRSLSPTTVNFNRKRIAQIIKLYIDDFDPKDLEEDKVMKVTLEDSLGQQDGVRLYFLLNKTFDAYEIILIDLFHLVIPSKHRKKGRMIDRESMLNITYNQNKNNNKCISCYFEHT
jgi:hypothetical protein